MLNKKSHYDGGMVTSVKQDDYQKTALRLPKELHAALHAASKTSGRSYNAELIARLQSSFEPAQSPVKTSDQSVNIEWKLRVEMRENEVRMETARSHLYMAQVHSEMLQQRLQNLVLAEADKEQIDAVQNAYQDALIDIQQQQAKIQQLRAQNEALDRVYQAATKEELAALDAVVDRSLQDDYLALHEREVAMGIPEDKRQIKIIPPNIVETGNGRETIAQMLPPERATQVKNRPVIEAVVRKKKVKIEPRPVILPSGDRDADGRQSATLTHYQEVVQKKLTSPVREVGPNARKPKP